MSDLDLALRPWRDEDLASLVRYADNPNIARFLTNAFPHPFSTNPASHRVLEKAGFTLEARLRDALYKNEAYMDELIFAIRR